MVDVLQEPNMQQNNIVIPGTPIMRAIDMTPPDMTILDGSPIMSNGFMNMFRRSYSPLQKEIVEFVNKKNHLFPIKKE